MSEVEPLVAIVTPVYNGAKFLEETIKSVQAQTYTNVIHIIHDNASTDATPNIIEKYSKGYRPVQGHRINESVPLTQNWNSTINRVPADAKYFRLLCADDEISPDFVRRMVDVAERHPSVGMVGCMLHKSDNSVVEACWPADREVFSGREALGMYFRGECWLPTNHALFRASTLKDRRPFYDETVITIDRDASLHVLSRHDLGFVHDDLAMTRMHPQSYTNTFVSDRMTYLFEWLYYLQRYGAQALEPSEFAQVCGPFRRYYLRQLMKWSGRLDRTAFVSQMEGLDGLGVRPRPWDYMDALLDWFIVRTGQRRVWPGFNLEWK